MKIIGFIGLILISGCGTSGKLLRENTMGVTSYETCLNLYQNDKWSETLSCLDEVIDSARGQAYYDLKGTALMRIGKVKEAIPVFRKALDLDVTGQNPYLYFKWAESLWLDHRYLESGYAMKEYQEFVDNPRPDVKQQSEYYLRSYALADSLYHIPRKFAPALLSDSLNTDNDELGLSMAYDRRHLILTRRTNQEDLYESHNREGVWEQAKPIDALNSPDNEGAASLSGDGQLLAFTACNRAHNIGSCDLYFSFNTDTGWTSPELLPVINSRGWDSQPSLSTDGRAIIFSSERPGGYGGRDLWVSVLGDDGWVQPINLGPSVNSPGNEENPFLHSDENTLYFTSDYWPGFGGRDLFMVHRIRGNKWSKIRNLGYPINSAKHEEGIFIESSGRRGYFSSARKKRFDLYSFEVDPDIQPRPSLLYQLTVVDSSTGQAIEGASIQVYDWTSEDVVRSVSTDQEGYAAFLMSGSQKYGITITKIDYALHSFSISIRKDVQQDLRDTVRLTGIEDTHSLILENVHFATGEARLLDGSAVELDQLADYLLQNVSMTIRLTGHTDNVGTTEDNQTLSVKRAETVKNYLTRQGIDAERIEADGQGESQPITTNDTPEGRQMNRRTVITIIR